MFLQPLRTAISEQPNGLSLAVFLLLILFLLSSAFSIFLAQVGYFGALALWCYGLLRGRSHPPKPAGFGWFFILYGVAELVATIFAHNQGQSLLYMQRRLLLLPIVYVILSNTSSRFVLVSLFMAMILSALGVALWGCRDLVLHFAEYARFERRMGEFQIYMTAGGIMMIVSLMLLPFLLHRSTPARTRWVFGLMMVPVGVNLLFTFTRSSWMGFLIGALVIGLRRHARAVLPIAGIVLLVVGFSSPEMRERMTSAFDPNHPNNVTRVHMWETGLRMFSDHPVVGIGDIGTEQLWDRYADPGWQPEGHLHNNLIMWFVTTGIIGFVTLVTLFVIVWIRLAQTERQVKDDWLLGSITLGALGVMAGFHVNGLFEWNFGDAEIMMLLWAITGLALAAGRIGRSG